MINLFWDLDGVLRNLTAAISKHIGCEFKPMLWDDQVLSGIGICQYIDLYPELLVTSPETEFCEEARYEKDMVILTYQPFNWISYTKEWIKNHFPNSTVKFCQHPDEKLSIIKNKNILLIEDYPYFSDNSQIIIIDHLYNWHVKDCYARVKSVEELQKLIYNKGNND